MAEIVRIGNTEYKKRGPIAVWLLSLVTFGIYFFVWYYKINKEARDYLGDETIKPGIALLAVLFGWILLLVPVIISILNTGKRIARMQQHAGLQDQISPGVGLLLFLIARLDMPYMQEHLNRIWKRYLEAQGPQALPTPSQMGFPPGPSAQQLPPPPGQVPPQVPPGQAPPSDVPPGQAPPQQPGGFTE